MRVKGNLVILLLQILKPGSEVQRVLINNFWNRDILGNIFSENVKNFVNLLAWVSNREESWLAEVFGISKVRVVREGVELANNVSDLNNGVRIVVELLELGEQLCEF